jgi:hypothetical protein
MPVVVRRFAFCRQAQAFRIGGQVGHHGNGREKAAQVVTNTVIRAAKRSAARSCLLAVLLRQCPET